MVMEWYKYGAKMDRLWYKNDCSRYYYGYLYNLLAFISIIPLRRLRIDIAKGIVFIGGLLLG